MHMYTCMRTRTHTHTQVGGSEGSHLPKVW